MVIGSKIIFISSLTSTNTYAIRLLGSEKPQEGTIISTDFQSAGRGQPGNKWESEEGKNLLFSLILYPEMIKPQEQFFVSMAISLGINDFLSQQTADSSIKWPNDIYVGNDKIAGILIESSVMGEKVGYMVAGIGLNINQENFMSNAPNPVSLKQITGKDYVVGKCLEKLAAGLDKRYIELRDGKAKNIREDYISKLYRFNEWAMFRDNTGEFTGKITSVGSDGGLHVEKRSGKMMIYYFKEIEFIL